MARHRGSSTAAFARPPSSWRGCEARYSGSQDRLPGVCLHPAEIKEHSSQMNLSQPLAHCSSAHQRSQGVPVTGLPSARAADAPGHPQEARRRGVCYNSIEAHAKYKASATPRAACLLPAAALLDVAGKPRQTIANSRRQDSLPDVSGQRCAALLPRLSRK